MTVSTIIPTYNREESIARAIKSVLSQTYSDLECIVVDDGSTDNTVGVVQSFSDPRVQILKHETNRGVSAARNTGINAAKGEYIAFLDSDDEWKSKKIERQVEYIQSKPKSWNMVYCGANKKRSNWIKQIFDRVFPSNSGLEGGEELIEELVSMSLSVHAGSTLLAEREAVLRTDGLDESLIRHEELEFLAHLLNEGNLGYVDENLVTLYGTGYPSADLLNEEKQKLYDRISMFIENGKISPEMFWRRHNYELAKAYFREGDQKEAYQRLKKGQITSSRDLAGLIWAIMIGFKRGSKSGK